MAKVKTRKLSKKFKAHQFEPGQSGNPAGRPKGTTLYAIIQQTLDSRDPRGAGSRRDAAADAYVKQMEQGSFVHNKEVLDRESGKVPSRLADAEGGKIKMYSSMPTEGDDAP